MADTSKHSAGAPESGEFLVYVCGIQVPCTSVDVNFGIWDPPTATISLPPSPLLRRLGDEDMVPVTVFYLDRWGRKAQGKGPAWCLLFDGFIESQSYNNTGQTRGESFQCVDLLKTMEMLRVYWLMNVSNIFEQETATGGNEIYSGGHAEYIFPASLFYYGLDPASKDPIGRPFDFVENIFRTLVGAEDEVKALYRLMGQWASQSPVERLMSAASQPLGPLANRAALTKSAVALHWWGRMARRRAFLERWVPMPVLEDGKKINGAFPILEALQAEKAMDAVTKLGESLGDGATMWDLIKTIFTQMHYQVTCVPAPPLVHTAGRARRIGSGTPTLAQYVTMPQVPFGVAPMCNVMWPAMVSSFSYTENYLKQPTRVLISDGNMFNLIGTPKGNDLQDFYNYALAVAYPTQFQELLDAHLGRGGETADPLINVHNFLLYPVEFYRGPLPIKSELPGWFLYLSNVTDPAKVAGQAAFYKKFKASAQTHIDKQIEKATLAGEGAKVKKLTDLRTAVDRMPISKGDPDAPTGMSDTQIAGGWVEIGAYLGQSRPGGYRGMKGASAFSDSIRAETDGGEDEKTRTLYAAEHFFLRKYMYRSGATTGPFHPYAVPGFPGFFFDDVDSAKHVAGLVMNVSHRLATSVMQTTVNFTYGRTTAELFYLIREQGLGLSSAPASPIKRLQNIFQKYQGASGAYNKLFYGGGGRKDERPTAFSLFRVFAGRSREEGADMVQPGSISTEDLDNENVDFYPEDTWADVAASPDQARMMSSRPVCTLEEWIDLHSPFGTREMKVKGNDLEQSDSMALPYYVRILELVAGPGAKPSPTRKGNLMTSTGADLRRNWQKRLLEYRTWFYGQEAATRA